MAQEMINVKTSRVIEDTPQVIFFLQLIQIYI
jgi:hypothetical protein